MRFLFTIHHDEHELDALPEGERQAKPAAPKAP